MQTSAKSQNVGRALLFLDCPSVCPSVRGHSNSVILIGFLPNLYMDCFHQPLVQNRMRVCLTSNNKDGQQNCCHLSISAVVVTLTQSFLIRFLPNFIYEMLLSNFHSSSNMGFIQHPITKMANKMATTYQCLLS